MRFAALCVTALAMVCLAAPAEAACRTSGGSCGVSTTANDRLCCPGNICGWGGVCQPGCRINGRAVRAGTRNPANACEACQPSVSTARWTTLADGTSCSDGQACSDRDTCQAGTCIGGGPRVNDTAAKLLECVTLEGGRAHQAALQAIADANNGNRVSGAPGYDASVAYVAAEMSAAGYQVTVQPFQYQTFIELAPSILEQVAPLPGGALANRIFSYSGSGDVTAAVTHLPAPPGDATPGCEAADFAGFPAGNIALISRGVCAFAIKATNAFNAGAAGVVIYNNVAGEINGTLGSSFSLNIPVTSVTQALGQQLAATAGLTLRLKTETLRGPATSFNVLAESAGGDPDRVVMAGAHLDSVSAGPGIQDNGSGSAALVEVARQMSRVTPLHKLRFAWWGAEEAGLVGSDFYVGGLSGAERTRIALYLNFDMIASPNFGRFVYDGDGSEFGLAGPPGSASIEQRLAAFYGGRGLVSEATAISFRSDYAAFFTAGIPIGGLFTGAEGVKSAQQVADYGGVAGVAFDPCYHQACDTFANVDLAVFDLNLDAVADAVFHYAMTPFVLTFGLETSAWTPVPEDKIEYWGEHQVR